MKRPYIIIHTHTAIDGSINTIDQPGFHAGSQHYQDIALTPGKQQLNIDASINGKTSTQDNITHYGTPEIIKGAAEVPSDDYLPAPVLRVHCPTRSASLTIKLLRLRIRARPRY